MRVHARICIDAELLVCVCSSQLQSLLGQLAVEDLSACSVTLHNMEEEEEEETLDLSRPSQSYFGHHIVVDISCE